jgi:hypothetical protein
VCCTVVGGYVDEKTARDGFYMALKAGGLGHKREGDRPSGSTSTTSRASMRPTG